MAWVIGPPLSRLLSPQATGVATGEAGPTYRVPAGTRRSRPTPGAHRRQERHAGLPKDHRRPLSRLVATARLADGELSLWVNMWTSSGRRDQLGDNSASPVDIMLMIEIAST